MTVLTDMFLIILFLYLLLLLLKQFFNECVSVGDCYGFGNRVLCQCGCGGCAQVQVFSSQDLQRLILPAIGRL